MKILKLKNNFPNWQPHHGHHFVAGYMCEVSHLGEHKNSVSADSTVTGCVLALVLKSFVSVSEL